MRIILGAILAASVASCSPTQHKQGTAHRAEHPSADQGAHLPTRSVTEGYMREAEEAWAQLVIKKNPALLDRVLADDFTGYFSDGSLHNKVEAIAAEKPDPAYKSARLDYVNYRHFGDMVVAEGVESAQRRDGGPDLRLAWTDVWAFRDGRWQVVATHVSKLPEKK